MNRGKHIKGMPSQRKSPIKNKGIAKAKKLRKRLEAEERNALTLPETRRQARLARHGTLYNA